ncbi:MAG: lysylphosphatidylglycerol synthase transmembrane domain-containing protein [Desulfococcaceae bacterium]|nr:lysylphosphatidylglycerol synthase transmembrane domain-containing protein [Desulfococcaceae bacterium]
MKKKTLPSYISALIPGLLISVPALWLAFRNVPFDDLLSYLASIRYFWLLPSLCIICISFSFRALRWQIIVRSVHPLSFSGAFHPLMIAFMMNCILPGRAGELARPLILKHSHQVPVSAGLATVAVERVFDLLLLLVFLLTVLAHVDIAADLNIRFEGFELNRDTLGMIERGMRRLCIILIAGIILVTLQKSRKMIQGAVAAVPSAFFFISKKSREKLRDKIFLPIADITESFASGFTLLRSWKKTGACLVLSAVIWILTALSYYVFSLGCPGIALSFPEMAAVMILICFFIALPSVPGFWGIWEAGGVFAMALFAVPRQEAAGFTLANHAIQVFPVIFIGLLSAMYTGVRISQISKDKSANLSG